MRRLLTVGFLWFMCSANAQQSFSMRYMDEPVSIGDTLVHGQEAFVLEVFKCYLSFSGEEETLSAGEDHWVHLIDLEDQESLTWELPDSSTEEITLLLGLPKSVNDSGAQSGALSPLRGMYWTWHSGYIHLKVELKGLNGADDRIHHLGGWQTHHAAAHFSMSMNARLDFDLAHWMNITQSQKQLMRESEEAVSLIQKTARQFESN